MPLSECPLTSFKRLLKPYDVSSILGLGDIDYKPRVIKWIYVDDIHSPMPTAQALRNSIHHRRTSTSRRRKPFTSSSSSSCRSAPPSSSCTASSSSCPSTPCKSIVSLRTRCSAIQATSRLLSALPVSMASHSTSNSFWSSVASNFTSVIVRGSATISLWAGSDLLKICWAQKVFSPQTPYSTWQVSSRTLRLCYEPTN